MLGTRDLRVLFSWFWLVFLVFLRSFFSGRFWERFWSVLGAFLVPKRAENKKNAKKSNLSPEGVFNVFWLIFGCLQTSKSMLPCTREHDFHKIAFSATKAVLGSIFGRCGELFGFKKVKNDIRNRFKKYVDFCGDF